MSLINKFKYENTPYSMISNQATQDSKLSFKARGLLCYLLSLPDDWKIYTEELCNHTTDGVAAIKSAMKELIKLGYIERTQPRNENGTLSSVVYRVYQESTASRLLASGELAGGKSHTTNKTKTKETINKSIYTFCSDAKTVHEYFFQEYEGFFGKQHRLVKRDTAIELETFMSDYSISQEDMIEKIDEFFKEDYDMDRCTLDYFVKAYCKRL
jgi:hypothetical protein